MMPLRLFFSCLLIALLLPALFPAGAYAQESEQVYIKGRRYLELNIHALDKYAGRLERTQKHLLNKLKRKEGRLARQLMHKDSAAYARFKANPLTYDSIAKLAAARPDSSTLAACAGRTANKTLDTLKGVYRFVQSKAGGLNDVPGLGQYAPELNGLGDRLSYDQYITSLTAQRTTSLESIAGNNSAFTGIQKEVFYAKSKIAEWKQVADDPSKAEELALEYLQGTKGFKLDANVAGSGNGGTGTGSGVQMPGGNTGADELEKLGFQTKRQVTAGLQQKYGSSLGSLQTNLGATVDKWQGEAQSLQGQVRETRQSLQGLKNTGRPKFKINAMRGLPFWKRIEKSYGLQTTRATTDGKPAMLQLAGMAGYRLNPEFSAGVGASLQIGLGQSWSAIHFSFEGVGLRSYVAWQWQYGFGLYGGYERVYKHAAFSGNTETSGIEQMKHDRAGYSEAMLAGITKTYKLNSKWNGAVQLLYDAWWQDKNLRSPLVLRFITQNKEGWARRPNN